MLFMLQYGVDLLGGHGELVPVFGFEPVEDVFPGVRAVATPQLHGLVDGGHVLLVPPERGSCRDTVAAALGLPFR